MKELRPPSSGTTEIRMLFYFDPARPGDLPGGRRRLHWSAGNCDRWYAEAIPLADERFTEQLIALKEEQEGR